MSWPWMTVASRKLWIFCSLVFVRNSSGFSGIRLTSSIVGGRPQTSGATARTPGMARSLSASDGRELAEDGRGDVLAEDHHPLDLVERVADQVPQAVRDAEQAEDAEDRHREAHQGQEGPERPGQQVEPGEIAPCPGQYPSSLGPVSSQYPSDAPRPRGSTPTIIVEPTAGAKWADGRQDPRARLRRPDSCQDLFLAQVPVDLDVVGRPAARRRSRAGRRRRGRRRPGPRPRPRRRRSRGARRRAARSPALGS